MKKTSAFLVSCFVVVLLFSRVRCKTDILTGYRVTVAVPQDYADGFIGRAFLMETDQEAPNFRVALSVEAFDERSSCSLEVFLGEVRVWNSGHYSRFYTTEKCVLELNEDGDLRLKGADDRVGWRTGTSGQGVKRLIIQETGNLALVDSLDGVKWQSFNFPTDVMLMDQSLNVATRLTSFPVNSSFFYSFEIQKERIALFLNSGKLKYSYWELKPSNGGNLTYIKLGDRGLDLFDDQNNKIAEIPSRGLQPPRFLALGNRTGNLGLYSYSPEKATFEPSFQAINTTCDLPLACKPYAICTLSNACSCIRLNQDELGFDCSEGISGGFCGSVEMEMLELKGVSSVLGNATRRDNVSKEQCADLCLEDCTCAAALFSFGKELQDCFLYRVVVGVKQIIGENGLSYMVKVPKGVHGGHGKSGLKRWVFVLVGVSDVFIILLVLGGLGYYLMQRRRKRLLHVGNDT